MHVKWQRARRLRANATDAERYLWRFLRRGHLAGWKFRRQYPIAGFVADFACVPARLVVELDDGQHAEAAQQDACRTRKLQAAGYRVIRFWNDDVLLRVDSVLEEILRNLRED